MEEKAKSAVFVNANSMSGLIEKLALIYKIKKDLYNLGEYSKQDFIIYSKLILKTAESLCIKED